MNKKAFKGATFATVLSLTLLTMILTQLPIYKAMATQPMAITIFPTSGTVGTLLRVNGTIQTQNGTYVIRWNNGALNLTGNAVGFQVDKTFAVPQTVGAPRPSGRNVTVELYDNTAHNGTVANFTLYTEFYISAVTPPPPNQIQEASTVNLLLNVTGGEANTIYTANITVIDPANQTHSTVVSLTNTTTNGYGECSRNYPNQTDFGPRAHTNFTGTYHIAFNETLAKGTFFVGLTNATRYSRFQVVNIRAVGYAPNEWTWLNITVGGKIKFSNKTEARVDGVIETNWTVPGNFTIGTYKITITNSTALGTVKAVLDTQTFDVVRSVFSAQFQTQNLSGDPLVGAAVRVANSTRTLSGNTSETGWVEFLLDADVYRVEAYWKDALVNATIDFPLTKNVRQVLKCLVTHLEIIVDDEARNPLPFVNVVVTSNYTTSMGAVSKRESFETNFTGILDMRNMLVNAKYTIEARRYGFLFNTTLIQSLTAKRWNNITIFAPTDTAFIHVSDSKNDPAVGLKLLVYDWSSSQPAQREYNYTDSNGNVTLSLTFGRYRLKLYKDDTFLKEVTINLLNQSLNQYSFVIPIDVYNVDLSVLVVDYFGQPIPNVLVEFQRKVSSNYKTTKDQSTGANGIARFNAIIGGDCRVSVSVAGRPGATLYMYLFGPPRVVVFKMDGYVTVVGYVLETSQFVTIVVLLILIFSFLIASTYKKLLSLFKRRRK